MAFVRKTVNPSECLGPDLTEMRERAGWTLAEAARQTKLTESLLRSFEEDRWHETDDPIYLERILRSYVEFLHGNTAYILRKYRVLTMDDERHKRTKDAYLPRTRTVRRMDLVVGSRLLTLLAFLSFVLVLAGYVWGQARAISTPPMLELTEPQESARLDEPIVRVRGQTNPEALLFVNGKSVIVQRDGSFFLTMNVPRGNTTISVIAKKRHGREAVLTRRVVFDRPLPGFASTTEQ